MGITKKIPLSNGQFATVDSEDYPYLSRFNWGLCNGHPARQLGGGKVVYMAQLIKPKESNTRFLFKDRNPLNLQKENVKVASFSNSAASNKKTRTNTTSKYRGVSWDKRGKQWESYITYQGHRNFLGYFEKEVDAAQAYNKKSKELYGEFAYHNAII